VQLVAGTYPALKRPVPGVDHLPQSSADVKQMKERFGIYLFSLWAIMAFNWLNLIFLIIIKATLQYYPLYSLPISFSFSGTRMGGIGIFCPSF
jgi:hypothetical protein